MINDPIRKELARFDRAEFADWLWRVMKSIYVDGSFAKGDPIENIGLWIRQYESTVEGIAQLYERYIPDPKRISFRQAVGDVLRNQADVQGISVQPFQDLIYLMARIRAAESLDALIPTVGTGHLGKVHPELLYETLGVLRQLAPSHQAYDVANDLVHARNFDEGYLFEQ